MSCPQCVGIQKEFNDRVAAQDLKRYRRRGLSGTTRMLVEGLKASGVAGRTLLDVGGGVGAIQIALLEVGAAGATGIDASPAYLRVAGQELERRGLAGRVRHVVGDFVDLAPEVEPADIVTLDRVICCYHDARGLLQAATGRARSRLALVYPRDNWGMRFFVRLANAAMWLRRSPFRIFIHPSAMVDGLIRSGGFEPRSYRRTLLWQVALYERSGHGAPEPGL